MGKATGFMEYKRETPKERPPKERIKDWKEFKNKFSEEAAKIQGARCMECGIPFCHSGLEIGGMVSGCPVNNLIPEWNDLIYKDKWEEAVKRLLKTNNFPEFTGRVCPAPCEGSCTVELNDPAVTIKANEYQIIEKAFAEGWIKPEPPEKRTGKSAAVVGSGPAGLAAADQLNKLGHKVTVYERQDRIGGLLVYGIPNMKLDKELVLKRRLDIMEAEGVEFITEIEIGKDLSLEALENNFDAVVLTGGATKPRDLEVPGREAAGVYFAVDYLKANTKHILGDQNEDYISAEDKDVIVIGGGDTGTDCAATAIRQGAKSVNQFEIMPKSPSERQADNPWPEWPKTLKVDYGQEEAIEVFGSDPREFLIMTEKIMTEKIDGEKVVSGVKTVKINWERNDENRFVPIEKPGTEKIWSADLILIAMGFLGPEKTLIEKAGIEQDRRSNVNADYGDFRTNVKGVFAAGDMRKGQSLVVNAIDEGRKAAREVDKYLHVPFTKPIYGN
ncbi:glutamate synthase subunit beta [Halanaerobium congolense]|jgi:glutamate synthase (NADPH/NADH) small chain|uniref:Glutamate synthase (NADPH/NADH) small chain n=1 Tax=Halanaerobium congolense TaxID=54121 RepID=A0A1G6N0L7_9FIRM|nr:glutamate synthase subunit beta [Halanaerobium congolense]KXS50157.1 MAG: glutamate synthase (NADPH/NADH) small chain [Halanaerobium sp. T82-1]OEG63339.1 MAG: glutamate synthase [Halanaerobium sp. MDAL1]PUU93168.1 MAG: glutamate synthase (NADPH/NADH) small chain [Halanaerobium sp.]TDS32911.1 glutamate synthase (NADPH/NADH) small chain [Halanaerobium congolense]TDX44329.1 NAD(P)H-dependent glutamate synthase small subunit [Halanaerobium congolense]